MKNKYKDRGFNITYFHGKNEVQQLRVSFAPAHLHTCAANDHIGHNKRYIQTIKECVRCGCHCMTYKKITESITRSLVQDIITDLNMLSSQNGILSNLIPVAIILGPYNPDYNKLKIIFGAYVKFYIVTTNSTNQRKVLVFAQRPKNNGVDII